MNWRIRIANWLLKPIVTARRKGTAYCNRTLTVDEVKQVGDWFKAVPGVELPKDVQWKRRTAADILNEKRSKP